MAINIWPIRLGRKPKGMAMTGAERARNYRMRQKHRQGIDPMSSQPEDQEIADFEEACRRLDMIKTFKDYPQTIGEIRSNKSDSAADWSPRDALIDMLRRIDSGVNIPSLVISFYVIHEDNEATTHYVASTKQRNEALGLLARTTWLVNEAT